MNQHPTKPNAATAWWAGTIQDFTQVTDEQLIGQLSTRLVRAHRTNEAEQLKAWSWQLHHLRPVLQEFPSQWRILFEYPLLRLGRRLDAVLLTERAIFVIEFKAQGHGFDQAARLQAEDYAFDLRDFHAASRDKIIIPVVIAGAGTASRTQSEFLWHGVSCVYESRPEQFGELVLSIYSRLADHTIDIDQWEHAPYRPVPTIIDAARAIYEKHGVDDIRAARADAINLSETTAELLNAVEEARRDKKHIISFVTGIPGAGKTLCGLDVAFSPQVEGTFLTGTLPMVYVLKAALARDKAKRSEMSERYARHQSKAKIESVVGFLRDTLARDKAPAEHVIVFDEAQRAWDAEYGARKFDHTQSEAAIMLDLMRRHDDYAVIVALVGNGQEINTGEAGLAEWGRALLARPEWHIRAAPKTLSTDVAKQLLFGKEQPKTLQISEALHLSTPIRNIRSVSAASWIDATLSGDRASARRIASDDLPIFVTRSLTDLRKSLKLRARGQRRVGLVCSSGAKRLVADGIWPRFAHQEEATVANWFLCRWPDVRASDALEIPATEFACQGLELDHVGLCWGGDLLWTGRWNIRSFRGTKWLNVKSNESRAYTINKYRVLLTRARADTIIWIPRGDENDVTRCPKAFNQTEEFLLECGAHRLPPEPNTVPEAADALLL